MSSSSVLQRKLITAILAGALLVPAASFAESRGRAPRKPAGTALASGNLFELFRSALANLRNETGCMIDPDGRCLAGEASTVSVGETGCSIDPSGSCLGR